MGMEHNYGEDPGEKLFGQKLRLHFVQKGTNRRIPSNLRKLNFKSPHFLIG